MGESSIGLKNDTRGAVLAEFVVAIMPILVTLFVFLQLAELYVAAILTRHAANMGARSAAVVLPPNPGNVGKPADVDHAVMLAFGPLAPELTKVEVVKTPASAPGELVTVEVRAQYKCKVPLGNRVVCGPSGIAVLPPAIARFPNQGAIYK